METKQKKQGKERMKEFPNLSLKKRKLILTLLKVICLIPIVLLILGIFFGDTFLLIGLSSLFFVCLGFWIFNLFMMAISKRWGYLVFSLFVFIAAVVFYFNHVYPFLKEGVRK